jgi:Holliday junction resolvase RusA-like endonuclease
MIDFFVPGAPVAAGSKKAFPVHGRDGRTHVAVTDDSGPKGVEWRAAIRHAAAAAIADVSDRDANRLLVDWCPVRLELAFVVARPRGHLATRGGVRPSAPSHPTTRPDVLKLARAVEDACTGILWRDDSQIVEELLAKRYAAVGGPIGVYVRVAPVGAVQGRLDVAAHR